MLLQLLVMGIEVSEFVWEDIGVRHEVEVLFPESLLHANHVETETVLPRDLIALWEMVDLLILVQSFIDVGFTA